MLSRADGDARTDIYVKAFFEGTDNVFFNDTRAYLPDGLTPGVVSDLEFPQASPYYPLDKDREIAIIAYSGSTAATDGKMILRAGTAVDNDYLLSNYGWRESDYDADPVNPNSSYEPQGTIGSANDPVAVLWFRHVMTQLTVSVELDPDEDPQVDRYPQTVQFTLPSGVITYGYYPLREPEITANGTQLSVDNTTAPYTVQLGVNYLVPTGVDLLGQTLQTLRIDDYTALPEDLTGYTIQALESQSSMELLPGYAYELILTISRLRLTGLRVEKIDWQATETDQDLTYTPYGLNVNLGNYDNTGENRVTKVILTTTDDRIYAGRLIDGQMSFVTLPDPALITGAELYTDRGLLITTDMSMATYDGSSLNMSLSSGGFLARTPGSPVSENNPYLITTPVQFLNVAKDLTTYYELDTTIDLNILSRVNGGQVFNGFGDFSGVFDGNGYRIDGIDIAAPGLFRINTGVLKNIHLSLGQIDATGYDYGGSICYINNGTIMACLNEACIENVAGTSTVMGGIVGQNGANGRVLACVNTGKILYGNTVGGICGANFNTSAETFVSCINTGMMNPEANNLGFICGSSADAPNTTVIRVCFGLVGSAQHYLGAPEYPVGTGTVEYEDTSSLESNILRNELLEGVTGDENRVVNRLNTALNLYAPAVYTQYEFVYDDPANPNDPVTGITWPAPVMK
ncbi:MAG: hypothetical protein LUD68_02025 [Rikenellaceae bacterium]|nr:hypothetical protein [Rikenellaceae bacterium]